MDKAIFFDLDGTLWDATRNIKDSWNRVLTRENIDYQFSYQEIKSFMGLTPQETGEIAFKDKNKDEQMRLFMAMFDEEIKSLAIVPGALYPDECQVLEELSKKYDLYVVSNAFKGYIENYLKVEGISQYFKGHLCAGDTGKSKAYNIDYLRKKINASKVIYVGDTYKDMVESEKAGVIFIHAAYGFGHIDNPKYKINKLNELPQLVESIN